MNQSFPVYTVQNECHDCYKCIRHCPSKAIKIKNGNASVIPDLCVACGICVKVCPAGAKRIRNDVSRAKFIISKQEKVIAALAPSWRSAFKNVRQAQLVDALKELGFDEVSEVALGAQVVSAATAEYLDTALNGLYISSACPAAVNYIRKYIPEYTDKITAFISPALTHAKMLKRHFGENSRVIFFGPCAAKKQESDAHPEIMSLALTFTNLINWLERENINVGKMPGHNNFKPDKANEGKLYALEGGMLDTIRNKNENNEIHFLALSGLHNIERTLSGDYDKNINTKLFVECLACEGGCINGPGMPDNCNRISDIMEIASSCNKFSSNRQLPDMNIKQGFAPEYMNKTKITEKDISTELANVGKYSVSDELNCGGCGYQSCRGFAKAVIEGKAEHSMCLSFLRKLAQKKSNAIIGQFSGKIGQIASAVIKSGFHKMVEVALGAELTTEHEVKDFADRMNRGERLMTTSCCPAYMETVKHHVPELRPYVSDAKTPMQYTAETIKKDSPEAVTVFIGPCTAKRKEASKDINTDYVMTFEELGAMFAALEIDVASEEAILLEHDIKGYARGFARSCGVSSAILEKMKNVNPEIQLPELKGNFINGIDKKAVNQLKLYAKGKLPGNFLEVMACEGGCVGGPCAIGKIKLAIKAVEKFASQ